jgi:hypothetical protein
MPDGIVGPRTAAALGLAYKQVAPVSPSHAPGPPTPPSPRSPLEIPVRPGPPAESAIAQLVEAVIQGVTEVQNGVVRIVVAVEGLPDVVIREIRDRLAGPLQLVIGTLRGCVRTAAANIAAAAGMVANAIRTAFSAVINSLQVCFGILAGLPDLLGLRGIADRIRSIISKLQQATNRIIDIVIRTLQGVSNSVFEAAASILGILRTLAAA